MGLLDFLDDVGDLVFGNKRFDEFKHFAQSKNFQLRRKVNATQLHLDVQSMRFFEGKKRKSIKGYMYKKDLKFNSLNQIFDYYYASDLGTTTTTIYMFLCEDLDLPNFIIKPKTGISKLGNIFSSTEWSEVSKDFDKSFTLESSDMNEMRMMLTFQFADVMLKLGNYTVEGNGNYLVLYKRNSKTDIIEMDNIHDHGLELLDIIINDHSNELV